MWLLGLEAGVAMFLLIFIVWWTMFNGKKPNNPPQQTKLDNQESNRENSQGDNTAQSQDASK